MALRGQGRALRTPANLGSHPDARQALRASLPHGEMAREDPSRARSLGESHCEALGQAVGFLVGAEGAGTGPFRPSLQCTDVSIQTIAEILRQTGHPCYIKRGV